MRYTSIGMVVEDTDAMPDGACGGSYRDHIQWAQKRAMEILNKQDGPGAIASFVSDMGKHGKARESVSMLIGLLNPDQDLDAIRRAIMGF